MRIQIDPDCTLDALWHAASKAGFLRADPRKTWTEHEKKEAARWFIERLVEQQVNK
jgi:hypothetical protein